MNGITIVLLVMLAIGCGGLSFTVVRMIDHIEVIQRQLDEHLLSSREIGREAKGAKLLAEAANKTAHDLMEDMDKFKSSTSHTLNEIRRNTYGTADVSEFKRVQTAAYAANLRSENLEKVIQAMNGRNITPRPRKSIQKGLMTVAVADDEKATDAEVRNSDG